MSFSAYLHVPYDVQRWALLLLDLSPIIVNVFSHLPFSALQFSSLSFALRVVWKKTMGSEFNVIGPFSSETPGSFAHPRKQLVQRGQVYEISLSTFCLNLASTSPQKISHSLEDSLPFRTKIATSLSIMKLHNRVILAVSSQLLLHFIIFQCISFILHLAWVLANLISARTHTSAQYNANSYTF